MISSHAKGYFERRRNFVTINAFYCWRFLINLDSGILAKIFDHRKCLVCCSLSNSTRLVLSKKFLTAHQCHTKLLKIFAYYFFFLDWKFAASTAEFPKSSRYINLQCIKLKYTQYRLMESKTPRDRNF